MNEEVGEPRRGESTSTVLARIEGKLNLVDFKFDDLRSRVTAVEARQAQQDEINTSTRLAMQQLAAEAKARTDTDAAASAAVKEARSLERETDEKRWTPKARFWTTALSLASVVSTVITFLALTHHL